MSRSGSDSCRCTAFRRRGAKAWLMGAAVLALAPAAAMAQSTGADRSARQVSPDAAADPILLGRVRVEGGETSSEGEVSRTAPVTAIEADDVRLRFAGDVQSALRSTPGVSTRQSSNQPGIEVNIRGLSGYGRVNAMIDGVPQAFKNIGGHEASGGSLLYVHPDLLAGIDITRGAVQGAHGAGTLAGAANFRTLSVEDVLLEGKDTGGLARLKFGDNGAHIAGAVALGARQDGLWGGAGVVDIVGAYAYSDIGDYKAGGGVEVQAGRRSTNSPKGGLVKIGVSPNAAHRFDLGARWYENEFANSSYNWAIDNQTYTADYVYSPGGDWLNLTANAYYNRTGLNYVGTGGSFAGRETRNTGYGLSVTNRVRTRLKPELALSLDYGVTWGREDFETLNRRGGNHPGKLDKASLFSDAVLDFGRYSLVGGLRYDYWKMQGYRPLYAAGTGDCPGPVGGPSCGDLWANRDGGRLLPKVGVTFAATPELNLYVTYAHTFRPPTSHEAFFSLVPFGNGVGTGVANNLDLKPETNKGWDLGADFQRHRLIRPNDRLHVKLGYFVNRIENYIVNDFVDVPGRPFTAMWVNRPGATTMQGLELEASYDVGVLYANLSASATDTDDQPIGDGAGGGNGEGSILPKTTATLDVGTRLLEGRLRLGVQARYTGEGKVAQFDFPPVWATTPDYTLIDAYGSFALNDRAEIFFTVENAEDKRYGYAASSLGGFEAQTGRGRTFVAGLSARF